MWSIAPPPRKLILSTCYAMWWWCLSIVLMVWSHLLRQLMRMAINIQLKERKIKASGWVHDPKCAPIPIAHELINRVIITSVLLPHVNWDTLMGYVIWICVWQYRLEYNLFTWKHRDMLSNKASWFSSFYLITIPLNLHRLLRHLKNISSVCLQFINAQQLVLIEHFRWTLSY